VTVPVGILLAQLGTPDAPTAPALRRYLRQFLGDPRVIEMNPVGRWLLLNLVVLPFRPRRSAALYRNIWTEAGSPLLLNSRGQAEGLQRELGQAVKVALGMRYGEPSIPCAIDELCAAGVERILLFSLYPQYSGPTTGSTYDEVLRWLPRRRVVPALRVVPPYHEHPAYIQAVAQTAREHIAALPKAPEMILISFHGIPKRYIEAGDIYRSHCERSAELIAAAMGLVTGPQNGNCRLAFQSLFGKEEWMRPYTSETIEQMGREGLKRIAVILPGFTADCLETIDEIGREGLHQFRRTGGEDLYRVPCLNTHPAWISAMARIARDELAGWLS